MVVTALNLKVKSFTQVPGFEEIYEDNLKVKKLIETIMHDEELLKQCRLVNDGELSDHLFNLFGLAFNKMNWQVGGFDSRGYVDAFVSHNFGLVETFLEPAIRTTIYGSLCRYADAYFQSKYISGVAEKARMFIAQNFPEIYFDVDYDAEISVDYSKNSFAGSNLINGKAILSRYYQTPLDDVRDFGNLKTLGPFPNFNHSFPCEFVDFFAMIHEYTHGIYTVLAGSEVNPTKGTPYYATADSALNEGLALLIELLSCDKIISSNCGDWNASDAFELRNQRLCRLNSFEFLPWTDRKSAYLEGWKIFSKLFENRGLEGVGDFLFSIDAEKTLNVLRTSEEYRQAYGSFVFENDISRLSSLVG